MLKNSRQFLDSFRASPPFPPNSTPLEVRIPNSPRINQGIIPRCCVILSRRGIAATEFATRKPSDQFTGSERPWLAARPVLRSSGISHRPSPRPVTHTYSNLRATVGDGVTASVQEYSARSCGVRSGIAEKMATEEIDRAKVPREHLFAHARRFPVYWRDGRDLGIPLNGRNSHVSHVIFLQFHVSFRRNALSFDEFPPRRRLKSFSISQKNQYMIPTC